MTPKVIVGVAALTVAVVASPENMWGKLIEKSPEILLGMGMCITAGTGLYSAWASRQAVKAQAEVARKVEVVRVEAVLAANKVEQTTTKAQHEVAGKLDTIHTLVNSQMTEQLTLNRDLARWKADQTKHPEDIAAAERAETKLAEHLKRQAVVDAKEGK